MSTPFRKRLNLVIEHLGNQAGFGPRILTEGAWVAASQAASAVAALVSIRLMTELLTPSEFGQLTLLVGVATLALGLSVVPRLQAVVRYYADWSRVGRVGALRRISARLVYGPATFVALAVAGGWVVVGPIFDTVWYAGLLVAAQLIVDTRRSFELALFSAARRQRVAAVVYVADAWARPAVAAIAILLFGAKANVALGGYVLGSMLVVTVLYVAAQLEGKERNHLPVPVDQKDGIVLDNEEYLATAIRRYALPLVPLALFAWISGTSDRYLVGSLLGLEHVGIYAATYGLVSRPFLMLSSVAELTIRPVLQNAISTGDGPLVRRSKLIFIMAVASGGVIGVLSFVLLNEWVAGLLLAEEYRSAAPLMPWIALGYAFYTISNVFSRLCYAFDDTKGALILTIAGALIGTAVMVPATMLFGLYGVAVAVPVRYGIELIFSTILARRAEQAFFARQKADQGHPQ